MTLVRLCLLCFIASNVYAFDIPIIIVKDCPIIDEPIIPEDCNEQDIVMISVTVADPSELFFYYKPLNMPGRDASAYQFNKDNGECTENIRRTYDCSKAWFVPSRNTGAWSIWLVYSRMVVGSPQCVINIR